MLALLSALLSACLACIPIAFDYRDERGRLNLWGRAALVGAVVSALVAFVAQTGDSREADRKQQRVLLAISRVLYQLKPEDMRVSTTVRMALNVPELEVYKRAFQERARLVKAHGAGPGNCETLNEMEDPDTKRSEPTSVKFLPCSLAFPHPTDREYAANALLTDFAIAISFGPKPDLRQKSVVQPSEQMTMLKTFFERRSKTFLFRARGTPESFEYFFDSPDEVDVSLRNLAVDNNYGSFKDQQWALPDLTGTDMSVAFEDRDLPSEQEDSDYWKVANASSLDSIELDLGSRVLFFSMLRPVKEDDDVEFDCTLPDKDILTVGINVSCVQVSQPSTSWLARLLPRFTFWRWDF